MMKAMHAVLPAADLDRASAFYRDRLGMVPDGIHDGMAMFRPFPGAVLGIYQTPNAGTAQHTQLCLVTDNLEADMAQMRSNGIVFENYDFPGMTTVDGVLDGEDSRTAWFRDSEGNFICVSQPT